MASSTSATSATTVQPQTVVTIRYRLDDEKGRPMQSKAEQLSYLHGGYGNLLPKIEAALEGQSAGFATTVDLPPQDGFGVRDESLAQVVPRASLPPGAKVGGQLQTTDAQGRPQVLHVVKIKGEQAHLDGNHPLAGKHVRFVVRILEIRAATPEEISHGHAHGEHGHHH
ncbi:MAG: peptidylprolyl isomerase [Comamonadaceae bacterium]|nr:peptidylprolyl isomerase [Comamonadaceae bacterium]